MREILFRGKSSCYGTWLFGNLVISKNGNPYIYPIEITMQDGHHIQFDSDEAFWVNPETVGQYTGLKDKNGKMIFEGDTLLNDVDACITVNAFHGYRFMWGNGTLCRADAIYGEVIGNIHDKAGEG